MNKLTFKVALLCAVVLPTQALAADENFCRKASRDFAKWVSDSKAKLSPQSLDQLQLNLAKKAEFSGVTNRLANRANMLLDKNVTESEANTDLYALCMSIT